MASKSLARMARASRAYWRPMACHSAELASTSWQPAGAAAVEACGGASRPVVAQAPSSAQRPASTPADMGNLTAVSSASATTHATPDELRSRQTPRRPILYDLAAVARTAGPRL